MAYPTPIGQISNELNPREIPFSLIVSAKSAEETHPEEANYQLHSSLADPTQQAAHFLLGALSIFATLAEELEEQDDHDAEAFKRWQGAGETLLNDLLTTAGESPISRPAADMLPAAATRTKISRSVIGVAGTRELSLSQPEVICGVRYSR